MLSIDPSQNSGKENYKLLIGSIVPRPIAFVTSLSKNNILNGAPFSYFNIVTANPPMISIAVQRKQQQRKDTAQNILDHKEFVVHIVDDGNVSQINETAANLPADASEIQLAGLTPVDSTVISVPGIREAKVRMECLLEQALELGGTETPTCDLIIGRIVHIHVNENLYNDGKIDLEALGAVSRLAGNDYAKIGEVFTIERPK